MRVEGLEFGAVRNVPFAGIEVPSDPPHGKRIEQLPLRQYGCYEDEAENYTRVFPLAVVRYEATTTRSIISSRSSASARLLWILALGSRGGGGGSGFRV